MEELNFAGPPKIICKIFLYKNLLVKDFLRRVADANTRLGRK
jgi:hypothetical protein